MRKRPRARARVCLCVLDTYRQSEIYVARGESGALKYYRFASRLHIHAWASEDEDGKTEIERERERSGGTKGRSVMKRREERIKKSLTGLKKNTGRRVRVVEIEMEKHGGWVECESGDSGEWDKEEFSGMKRNVGGGSAHGSEGRWYMVNG